MRHRQVAGPWTGSVAKLGLTIVAACLSAAPGTAQLTDPGDVPAAAPPDGIPHRAKLGAPVADLGSDPIPATPTSGVPSERPGCPADPNANDCGTKAPERRLQLVTGGGGRWSGLPGTLLWEPPLAGLREPRFMGMPSTQSSPLSRNTVDTTLGNTLGLLRFEPASRSWAVQFDVFAATYSRFSQYNYLVETDYRVGLPVTLSWGQWHAKLGYEHTSTHLGDETIRRTGRVPFDYIKEEIVFGLGRYLWEQRLRVYGQVAWAHSQIVPGNPSPWRFDLGSEWVRRRDTGRLGQPFAAGNLEFNGAAGFTPNLSLQAGWMWREPDRRLAQCRLFAQYFTGPSFYGQLFQTRENWFGFGIASDY